MMYGWGNGWMGGFGGFGGGFLMFFFSIVLVALIIWAVMAFARHGRYGYGHAHAQGCCAPGGNALDIARERYARGEINKEQFETMKKDLG
jgi:putative membrane protein